MLAAVVCVCVCAQGCSSLQVCTSARGRLCVCVCKYTSLFREGGRVELVTRGVFLLFVSAEVRVAEFDVADVFGHTTP